MKGVLTVAFILLLLSGMVTAMASPESGAVSTWSENEVQMARMHGLAEWADADVDVVIRRDNDEMVYISIRYYSADVSCLRVQLPHWE